MDIPPVQVQMLGRFVIRRGSQEVSVSGRSQKLCLLLAALIWERDRPLSYHELTQLLWAETGHGPNPVNALKAILHRARLCLDGLGEGSGRSLLLHRDGGLQWSPQVPLTLDAEQFSLLTHEAGQPLGEDQALALQMEALSLYQGRLLPMLDGCPWTAGRAEPLHQTYLQTVFRTLPVLERQSRWQDAAQTAGAALALEPCRDDLCLWQMRALLQLERRTEAVQVYESFQERLLSQRGVIPSDELRALCRKARQDSDPSLLTPDTLQERLAEPPFSGALLCDFDFFRVLCHAAARRAGREAAPVHSALISLSGAGDAPPPLQPGPGDGSSPGDHHRPAPPGGRGHPVRGLPVHHPPAPGGAGGQPQGLQAHHPGLHPAVPPLPRRAVGLRTAPVCPPNKMNTAVPGRFRSGHCCCPDFRGMQRLGLTSAGA